MAPDNPWEATSLEWTTTSPPPFDNFGGAHPVVYHGPNEYGVTRAATATTSCRADPPSRPTAAAA